MLVRFYVEDGRRSRTLAEAMGIGMRNGEDYFQIENKRNFNGGDLADVAVLYGLWDNSREIIKKHISAGKKTLFFDLGYWGRHEGGRLEGYHRIAINDYHAKFEVDHSCPSDRFDHFDIKTKEFRSFGDYVLLCGQSEKAAWVYGLKAEEWEISVVRRIREITDLPIYYLPKNSWKDKKPIPRTRYCHGELSDYLGDCAYVVTHHSNSGVHALAAGKNLYAADGIATSLSNCTALDNMVNGVVYPGEELRDKFLHNVAYWQWSVNELRSGAMWEYLRKKELV